MAVGVPTLRQQRLGVELRRLRERSGLSSTAAAERVGIQQARMSSIEAGRYAVSADRVRAFAHAYACADDELVEALAAMTGGRTRGWWEEYAGRLPTSLLDLAELEHHACAVRVSMALHIPGLLQTPDHTRALLQEVVPPLRHHEVEHRLSHRMKRQEILHGESPVPYTAVIHEAALRMRFGGRGTTRCQLRHLLDVSEYDNVCIRVVPFELGTFIGTGQPVDYLYGPVPKLDTVQLDTHHGCEFLDAEAQLSKYQTVLDRIEAVSLEPTASRDIIRRIEQSL